MEFLKLSGVYKKIKLIMPGSMVFAILAVLLAVFPFLANASTPSVDEVKAAFVYNFAKFVEWPEMDQKKNINVKYLGENPLSGSLLLISSKKVNEISLSVEPLNNASESVDILFIPSDEFRKMPEILKDFSGKPVLSVSDSPDFVRSGGIIGLKIVGNRVRFEVNLKTARESGLKVSSQLLSLAMEVLR